MKSIKPRGIIGDGYHKILKEDCKTCNYNIEINEEELCGVGKAFKYLSPPMQKRKCVEKDKLIVSERSIEYLIKIKNKEPIVDAEQLRLWA